jgi:hypothetical protein
MTSIIKVNQIQDGGGNAIITSDGSGNVTTQNVAANTPSFRAYMSASQTVNDVTNTVVAYNTENFDTDSAYNTSTYRFTVPSGKAGKYFFSAQAYITDSGNSLYSADFQIRKNGTNQSADSLALDSSDNYSYILKTNNNRVAIMDGMVNMDDLLTTRPGGVVRTKQPPNQVMQPLQAQPISQQAFPLLTYLDSVREVRTGVTKQSQGLDPDTLNAKTATGVNALMTQTQMRSELIARIFAETGVKDLFKKIFELMVKYQDKERIVMINNQYVPVKPTEWKDRFNISIVVGLGTGSKEQQLIVLNSILERQLQAFQLQGGKEMPMVTLKNMYNTLSKIIENAGLKNVESYFVNPDIGKQMMPPPAPPPLTPIEKIEFTRIDAENKRKIADLELQAQELQQKTQQMALDFEAKIKEMALKYNTQLDTAKIKADADLDKMMMAGENKILEQATKSTNMFSQQVQGLNGNQRSGGEVAGSQPIPPSQTGIRE